MLDFEKLEVYQAGIELRRLVTKKVLPHCSTELRDQLDRASVSIVLNIAEGAGRWQPRDKRRFYEMARGSACESAAVLAVLRADENLADTEEPWTLLERIIKMLSRLCLAKS